MLLDVNRNLILCDLDRGMKIGEDVEVLTEPFGRLLNKEDGAGAGTYGNAGVRTESFAIGSVHYTLLRGHKPYETEGWGEYNFILAKKLQEKKFPQLDDSIEDMIICKCWNGDYQSISALSAELVVRQDEIAGEDQEYLQMRQMECERFVQSGCVDKFERY